MKKYLVASVLILAIFSSSCKSTPEVSEGETSTAAPMSTGDTKYGYVLVPGMDIRETDRGLILVLEEPINFASNASSLPSQYDGSFKVVDQFLTANGNSVTRIIVEGHTDEVGTRQHNMILSEKRALSGVEKLSDQGVSRSLMRTQPLADTIQEYSGANAHRNRRVEFVLIKDSNGLQQYRNALPAN